VTYIHDAAADAPKSTAIAIDSSPAPSALPHRPSPCALAAMRPTISSPQIASYHSPPRLTPHAEEFPALPSVIGQVLYTDR
jgi:hypothetical protein